ncbi:MAG TPA: energy-coupled thiamine transporter ThiT [Clostridia bacterium]|nr:energy-coupled thiamine transporter ThiT [Clostridia bacterium]
MDFTLFEELGKLKWFSIAALVFAAALTAYLIYLLFKGKKGIREKEMPAGAVDPTLSLVYGALCVALSFILSYLRLFRMPQGGSLTIASMLPIALYSQWFGLKRGLLAGAAFGFLQLLQDAYIVHLLQLLLDYPLAFMCVGLAGLFPNNLPLGLLAGGLGRILCSTLSGAIFFAQFSPEGMNPWAYSFVYNALALGPDQLICIVLALMPPVKRAISLIAPKLRPKESA